MKIIILHGDDVYKSQQRLDKFIEVAKKRDWEISRLEGSKVTNLGQELSSKSLFQKERLVIIEEPNKLTRKNLKWFKVNSQKLTGTIILYSNLLLSPVFLKELPENIRVEIFRLPKIIFTFLDSFYPKNGKNILKLLHKLTEDEPIEFIFSLLARQMRDLYWISCDPAQITYPSWRLNKLKIQSKKFTPGKLKELIAELSDIDIKAKTSEVNLLDSLDQLIITKLE
jgi:DNA polymerase III delta subunit